MKIQFLFLSAFCAIANAGFSASIAPVGYEHGVQIYDQHIPVIHNGVPVETPEVQAAKAAHFEAYAKAQALAAQHPSDGQYHEYAEHEDTTRAIYKNYVHQVPQSDVYSHAISLGSAHNHHYRGKRSIFEAEHIPILGKDGVPEETPEVQAAKYQHLVAHASAHSYGDYDDSSYYGGDYYNTHESIYHIPVVNKHGVPEETPDVKLARQQHLYAHYLAKTGDHSHYGGGSSEHIPVIGPNGVPYDTPEVQIAKAQHLAAYAKESANHNQWALPQGYGSGGYGSHYF